MHVVCTFFIWDLERESPIITELLHAREANIAFIFGKRQEFASASSATKVASSYTSRREIIVYQRLMKMKDLPLAPKVMFLEYGTADKKIRWLRGASSSMRNLKPFMVKIS